MTLTRTGTRADTHTYMHTHTGTSFQRVIGDSTCAGGSGVSRVVFCSGKIYYELLKERERQGLDNNVAILRVEQVKQTG